MYKMTFDYHTHTTFSHGKGSIEDNVNAGIRKGLREIAITDHGPGHLTYGVKKSDLSVMRKEVDGLKILYPEIKIYLGIEANICNRGKGLDIQDDELKYFDFIIAGYHYGILHGWCISNWLFNHGIFKTKKYEEKFKKRNTNMTINALKNNKIKILTHPGDKAPFDIDAIAKVCEEECVWMEISTHHSHLTVDEIEIAARYKNTKFVISSDAHHPDIVGTFHEGVERAKQAKLDLTRIVNIKEV